MESKIKYLLGFKWGIGILLSYMLRLQVISNAIILMGFMMKSSLASGGIRNWEGISHILL